MASVTGRSQCLRCGKDKATAKCIGCLQDFCFNHLAEHRQELIKQLDEVEIIRDTIKHSIIQQTNEPQKHPLIEQIDQWEQGAIRKIQENAEEARQIIVTHMENNIHQIEVRLSQLTKHLKQSREEDDITEIDLQAWKHELTQLREEFIKPSGITIHESSTSLINYLQVDVITHLDIPDISKNIKWIQNGITVTEGNKGDNKLNPLCDPCGMYISDGQTIYVADYCNHRVMKWFKQANEGHVAIVENGQEEQINQFNGCVDLSFDQENNLYVVDLSNHQVQKFVKQ